MSSSESFYWHDYETSGASPAVDRPVQFAGVRTDMDFNVIGEPLVIYNRPCIDCLPHPEAVRITAIDPRVAATQGFSERTFIEQINNELSQPGTCGIGYNSIRFDDEVTRYTLYRNFFEPYAREYGQGRSRWDLIDVARAHYALRPDGVQWPTSDDGKVSFKLEALSAANGIEHSNAHDALSDVLATIGLAKVLKRAQPALFDTLYAHRSKAAIAPLLDIVNLTPVVHVSGMFGLERSCLAVVVPLARHPDNSNEIICADLGREPDFLYQDAEDIRRRLFAKNEDLSAGEIRPALKTIRINKAPVVMPVEWVKGETAERLGLNGEQHKACLGALRSSKNADPEAFDAFIKGLYQTPKFAPRTDPDTQLYDGFVQGTDKATQARVRAASPDQLREQTWVFNDQRLPELLFRYRARNYPESLSEAERLLWWEHCRERLQAPDGFNLDQFATEMSAQRGRDDLSAEQVRALDGLEAYVAQLRQQLGVAVTG